MSKSLKIILAAVIAGLLTLTVFLSVKTLRPTILIDEGNKGAITSPDLPYEYIGVNGIRRYSQRDDSLTSATTTICSLRSPTNATSTLASASLRLSVGTTTNAQIEFGKATTPYATTTRIGSLISYLANKQVTVQATTTPSAGSAPIFAPGAYLNIKMTAGAGKAVSPTGVCQATWESLY